MAIHKELDNSISAQIAEARRSVNERPDWMKSIAHFSEPRIESVNSTNTKISSKTHLSDKKHAR